MLNTEIKDTSIKSTVGQWEKRKPNLNFPKWKINQKCLKLEKNL